MRLTHSPTLLIALAALSSSLESPLPAASKRPNPSTAWRTNPRPPRRLPPRRLPRHRWLPLPCATAAPFNLTQQPGEHPLAPTIRVLNEVLGKHRPERPRLHLHASSSENRSTANWASSSTS